MRPRVVRVFGWTVPTRGVHHRAILTKLGCACAQLQKGIAGRPALALLGKLTPQTAVGALVGTLLFAGVARAIWISSIRRYTSASS